MAKSLKVVKAKKENTFTQVQQIYDMTRKLSDKDIQQKFMIHARSISKLRSEFAESLELCHELELEIDQNYVPSFASLNSVDEMCNYINSNLTALENARAKKEEGQRGKSAVNIKAMPCLPQMEICNFDGSQEKWPVFYQLFQKLIHENESLSDLEKINYLVTHLQGSAKSICTGVVPTAENYQTLYQSLVQRYEDKRQLASTYLTKILDFKPITNESEKSLNSFLEHFVESVSALKNLNITDLLNFIFLHIALKKLDLETSRQFEMTFRKFEMPSFENLVEFLREQAKILNRSKRYTAIKPDVNNPSRNFQSFVSQNYESDPRPNANKIRYGKNGNVCVLCLKSKHQLYSCSEFHKKSVDERWIIVKEHKACFNCLSVNSHRITECKSKHACTICKRKHHSLLHRNPSLLNNSSPNLSSTSSESQKPVLADAQIADKVNRTLCSSSLRKDTPPTMVLLATAQVTVYDVHGNPHSLRALIDSGSQSHLITPECCKKLGLSETTFSSVVKGLGSGILQPQSYTKLTITTPMNATATFTITALVTEFIQDCIPSMLLPLHQFSYLKDLPLADPNFYIPGKIDLLIGAALWPHLLKSHKVYGPKNMPSAIETLLGYIIIGELAVESKTCNFNNFCATLEEPSLDQLVRRFWSLEEIPSKRILNAEEKNCEEFFLKTYKRDSNGKFSVALPFKQPASLLGASKKIAIAKYLAHERRLLQEAELHLAYSTVMQDNLNKNYMSWVSNIHEAEEEAHYLHHHGVYKPQSSSTPLRIVFNASAKTSNGKTLNSLLHVGPKLYPEIFDLLLNFRLFEYAVSADISKMYLQIGIHPEYRQYQRLIWRPSTEIDLQVYELNTVLFGATSSPYLAQRVIRLLADLEKSTFPIAADVVQRDVYMDDLVTSTTSPKHAIEIYTQVKGLFELGGFTIKKWCSNSLELMECIPENLKLQNELQFDKDITAKVLGVQWSPQNDVLSFKIALPDDTCTKRSILSMVARTFDPLGLLTPVITIAKILIQELWSLQIDWDEKPPAHIIERWNKFCKGLPLLTNLEFPRHSSIKLGSATSLIGFADASEKAYGAAVYIRTQDMQGIRQVVLLCAKSRVAPLKIKSIPRLELCAALILSKLMRHIIDLYKEKHVFNEIIAFSDSTVTLHWINSNPARWKVFVANRVSQIQENIEPCHWRHVSGKQNPSDCLSRGLAPEALGNNPLWFLGPSWLILDEQNWPIMTPQDTPLELVSQEVKLKTIVGTIHHEPFVLDCLLERTSTYKKLLKSTVYVLRFLQRKPVKNFPITISDLNKAEEMWIKHIQDTHFKNTIDNLKNNQPCEKKLRHLDPFIEDGLLRVGGRLQNSDLPHKQRYPILLPKNNQYVDLLIDHCHQENLHTGSHLVISLLHLKYWIISIRNQVRRRLKQCNICFKAKPQTVYPKMAPLPQLRVQQAKAFSHCGVDYAGPYEIIPIRKRGIKTKKAYICLFVCLAVKAIHIELVTELSTPAFLNAFKRFLARRGPCSVMLSDCGTNFIGAKNQLDELSKFVISKEFSSNLQSELVKHQVDWRFNPPAAPHFGGIWESNIKSVKTHLKKVMGQQILTYEEFMTLLIQIEALLNSRPLCTLKDDPNAPTALTPAHFLTLGPTLDSLPAEDVITVPLNRLNRYQLIDNLLQNFWKRWSTEYLHTLQSRKRWTTETKPITEGTVVILKKENRAPLEWPLGVVEKTYEEKDGIVRVVDVRSQGGSYRRPVTKICPLPSQ